MQAGLGNAKTCVALKAFPTYATSMQNLAWGLVEHCQKLGSEGRRREGDASTVESIPEGSPPSPTEFPPVAKEMVIEHVVDTLKAEAQWFYVCPTDSDPAWVGHLKDTPAQCRELELTYRRLIVRFLGCRNRDICFFCWNPNLLCMCSKVATIAEEHSVKEILSSLRSSRGSQQQTVKLSATMVFHGDELLRLSNTGHLAAMVLDAALLVKGFPPHDAMLLETSAATGISGTRSTETGLMDPSRTYLLYPCDVSVTFDQLLEQRRKKETSSVGLEEQSNKDSPQHAPAETRQDASTTTPTTQHHHMVLLDTTWNLAKQIHRFIPSEVPRVGLSLANDYTSMFQGLRKQSRDTGVSTLEATGLAIQQLGLALAGEPTSSCTMKEEEDTLKVSPCANPLQPVFTALTDSMEYMVDSVRMQKCQEPVFGSAAAPSEAELQKYRYARQTAKVESNEAKYAADPDQLRALLPKAPVLLYCEVCELRATSAIQLCKHVVGSKHQRRLAEVNKKTLKEAANSEGVAKDNDQ